MFWRKKVEIEIEEKTISKGERLDQIHKEIKQLQEEALELYETQTNEIDFEKFGENVRTVSAKTKKSKEKK